MIEIFSIMAFGFSITKKKLAYNKSPVNVATPISRVKCHRSSFNHNCWRPYEYRLSRCVRASTGCVVELFNPNYEHDSTAIGVATIHHPPHRPGSSYQNHKQTPNIQTTNRKPAAAPISIVWREKKKRNFAYVSPMRLQLSSANDITVRTACAVVVVLKPSSTIRNVV